MRFLRRAPRPVRPYSSNFLKVARELSTICRHSRDRCLLVSWNLAVSESPNRTLTGGPSNSPPNPPCGSRWGLTMENTYCGPMGPTEARWNLLGHTGALSFLRCFSCPQSAATTRKDPTIGVGTALMDLESNRRSSRRCSEDEWDTSSLNVASICMPTSRELQGQIILDQIGNVEFVNR